MIYTGYYSKLKDYVAAGLKTISISKTSPNGVVVYGKIPELAPDDITLWRYKNREIDEMEYTSRYLGQLDWIGIKNILLKIHHFGDDVVLLCWESPEKFCHRHILADYLNKHTKLNVKEYEQSEV